MLFRSDMELFDSFGEYLKKTIQAAPEWKAVQGRQASGEGAHGGFDDMESDIPF